VACRVHGSLATLAADGGTAYALQTSPGVAVIPASLIAGTPYCASFNSSQPAWVLFGAGWTAIPLGTVLDYTGAVAPSSNFALPFGKAISRTTFAAYFALVGTTYGAGDGSTTFNIPDLRGRAVHGLDNMGGSAGRIGTALVTDGGTLNGQTLGSAAGSQNHAQTTGELATHSHANTLTDPGHTHTTSPSSPSYVLANSGTAFAGSAFGVFSSVTINSATTGISINNVNTGSANAMALMPPVMMLNKIIRVQ
jgi:microcystin-dependent protein